ncbi:PaaI family thioesterase [Streptomyces sp. NPDC051219]|uniref:PaaI family thioesterase n=1 Tax=Streptomyces sp. NPDC051219 TaxID=3155283 RepID=UPI00342D18D0
MRTEGHPVRTDRRRGTPGGGGRPGALPGRHPAAHGACHAADNAITFAAGTVLGPAVLTGGFSIHHVRPAAGRTLVARASVVHGGRRQAVCRSDLYVADETGTESLCAVAQGTVLSAQK